MNRIKTFISVIMLAAAAASCTSSQEKDAEETTAEQTATTPATEATDVQQEEQPVVVSGSKAGLRAYYDLPHLREFYEEFQGMEYTEPPALNVPEDLSSLSYEDLRLLRNEMFARNGHLFSDGFLRGYFNRYKWYMPVFDVDTFKVMMTEEEQALVKQLLAEEEKRKEKKYTERAGLQLLNADLVVNRKQFKSVDPKIMQDLQKDNFSIVATGRSMPFYIYDQNAYQFVPHYITTDLYLFILHKYFSVFLEKLDENYMSKQLNDILQLAMKEVQQRNNNADTPVTDAYEWLETYLALALYAGGDRTPAFPAAFDAVAREEISSMGAEGSAVFIPNRFVSYTELMPRGHYTKSEVLQNYFRRFKWISLNGVDLKDDNGMRGLIMLAHIIRTTPDLYEKYKEYTGTVERLAGQEDNVSLKDMISAVGGHEGSPEQLVSPEGLAAVRESLQGLNKERIKKVFGEEFKTPEKTTTRVHFLSATYSVSGEVFSRLVHINDQKSKRPFPKGLDIPAVFGNVTAEHILLEEYREGEGWPDYKPRLQSLQQQFKNFEGWDHNYGTIGLKTALTAASEEASYPDFMKSDEYNRKELSTMLSSWTHIKHDLVLYQEKPFAAEAGQGGGPEPPKHYSYVEPNLVFWDQALRLVEWLQQLAELDDSYKYQLQRIRQLGELLQTVANKQIKGEAVTEQEYRELHWVGGTIEHLLLSLLETDHLPEREKSMALIADVYQYNLVNLNVAVGHADDIYVLVPLNGEYHIARGSVFSYYEFKDKQLFTDEAWRARVNQGTTPARPEWLHPIINQQLPPLEGQMEYRY